MKPYLLEVSCKGKVIHRNYINSYTFETVILAGYAIATKYRLATDNEKDKITSTVTFNGLSMVNEW